MTTQHIFTIALLLALAAYVVWTFTKRKQAVAGMGPAVRAFFERTGFRYAEMAQAPIEAHVARAVQEGQTYTAGDRTIHYVRNFHGLSVHWVQSYEHHENKFTVSCQWSAPLQRQPRIPFHIADRSLDSMGKAVREAFSNTKRVWSPRHPHQVTTGNPQIDGRFLVYGHDPQAVAWMLSQNPALIALLMQSVEVDLYVDATSAVFVDPLQKNMNAAMGGMVGNMALGFDIAKRLDLSIPVHDRMSEIIAHAVRASA